MKYLVIGGAGFIGSHLTEYLVSRGNKVKVYDNFSTGLLENIAGLPIEIIEGDIRNIHALKKAVRDAGIVFHLAALSSSDWPEDEMHAVNVQGTSNVLDACMDAGVKRVVFSSSSSVYRANKGQTYHEYMDTTPVSPYGVSKLLGEFFCQAYSNLFHLETVILRYFNVFGPRQTSYAEDASAFPLLREVLGKASIQIAGDGSQRQDLTYIDNVVHANALAATCPTAAGKIFNIAEGKSRSALEFVRQLKECTESGIRVEYLGKHANADTRSSRASIDSAQKFLRYSPMVGFEEGLARTVNWHRQIQVGKAVPVDVPAVVDALEAAPVPQDAFPRVREISFAQKNGIPLQIQRWLSDFTDLVVRQPTGSKEDSGRPGKSRLRATVKNRGRRVDAGYQ